MSRLSSALERHLVDTAKQAQEMAYAPITKYRVGAAVLTGSGRIYAGCNVEPPSLINQICAERAAIANAITHGERKIEAVCTVSRASEPCGACRQFIREFSAKNAQIISIHRDSKGRITKVVRTTIEKLLPHAHTGATIARK